MLDLLAAQASRAHVPARDSALAMLRGATGKLPADRADYLLRSAMLASLGLDDAEAVLRIEAEFGGHVPADPAQRLECAFYVETARRRTSAGASSTP